MIRLGAEYPHMMYPLPPPTKILRINGLRNFPRNALSLNDLSVKSSIQIA